MSPASPSPPPRAACARWAAADSDWSQAPALGLVEAYLNPSDGRSHVIQLTERGREMRDRLDAHHPPGGDHPAGAACPRGLGVASPASRRKARLTFFGTIWVQASQHQVGDLVGVEGLDLDEAPAQGAGDHGGEDVRARLEQQLLMVLSSFMMHAAAGWSGRSPSCRPGSRARRTSCSPRPRAGSARRRGCRPRSPSPPPEPPSAARAWPGCAAGCGGACSAGARSPRRCGRRARRRAGCAPSAPGRRSWGFPAAAATSPPRASRARATSSASAGLER